MQGYDLGKNSITFLSNLSPTKDPFTRGYQLGSFRRCVLDMAPLYPSSLTCPELLFEPTPVYVAFGPTFSHAPCGTALD